VTRIRHGPRPLDLAYSPQLGEQERVQPLPYACLLPLIQAAVAGRTGAEAELERQMPPCDSGVQYEENPLQRLPVGQTLAAWEPGTSLHLRQQRLDTLP
jgi:hypothetical protein